MFLKADVQIAAETIGRSPGEVEHFRGTTESEELGRSGGIQAKGGGARGEGYKEFHEPREETKVID